MERADLDSYYAANIRLIHSVAIKGHRRLRAIGSSLEYEDVVQELSVVFMKAYEKFDDNAGFQFSSYFMSAAYHRINLIAEVVEKERITYGVRSVEELNANTDDEMDFLDLIPSGHATPEQVVELADTTAAIREQLSPLALKILELTLDPPEFIERELEAEICNKKLCRDAGKEKRARSEITAGFVCKVLNKAIKSYHLQEARRELLKAVNDSLMNENDGAHR